MQGLLFLLISTTWISILSLNPDPAVQKGSSISPYQIKRFADQHRRDVSLEAFWKLLKIPTEDWQKYGNCETNLFHLDLDWEAGREVLLRLYDDSGGSMGGTRYLLFKPVGGKRLMNWRLLGYVDHIEQRYSVPNHRVISAGKNRWLKLTVLVGRGSGYGLYHDIWYEVTARGWKEVLHYPSGKFIGSSDPIMQTDARVINVRDESGTMKVSVLFSANYYSSDEYGNAGRPKVLWVKKRIVTFIRRFGESVFQFDVRSSGLSRKAFDLRYDGEEFSDTELLRHDYNHLKKIAIGQNKTKRKWLRSFLDRCDATTEKIRLLRLLSNQRN